MIAAVVLAAGLSRRMGTNKLLLPFAQGTVLSHIVSVLQTCPLDEIVVVTGHEHEKVEEMLGRYPDCKASDLRFAYNPNYATGEMLSSIQVGLATMRSNCEAALIVLGDQPHIERRIVEQVIAAYKPGAVVIPSFNRRGGHPILIDRGRWPEVLALPLDSNLREMLRARADWLHYVEVDTETILRDVDTPDDYERAIN